MSARNVRALALALLLFVYPIIVLSFASIRYTETIHRISTSQTFDQSIFGSVAADSLAALGFLALFTGLAFRFNAARIGSIAVFAAGIALYLASPGILQLAGIATLPSLMALLAVTVLANRSMTVSTESHQSRSFRFGKDELYRMGSALLVIIIVLEIVALSKWVTHPFFPTEIYSAGDPLWRFAKLESALFHSLGLLSPFLTVVIAFSFLYRWFIPDLFRRIRNVGRQNPLDTDSDLTRQAPTQSLRCVDEDGADRSTQTSGDQSGVKAIPHPDASGSILASYTPTLTASKTIRKHIHLIILSAALIISPLVMMYPHLPGVNQSASGVSTDELYYMNWMMKLRESITSSTDWTSIVATTFTINNGDRPLTLLIIFAISNIIGSSDLIVIRFLPVALAPMLVFSNYLLIRYSLKSSENKQIVIYAALGAVFAALSPQIIVGEYAGFLANWMALIAGYFAFLFLIKGWESQDRKRTVQSFGILFAILLVMMLIHVYTWAHLLATILLFGCLSFIFARKSVTIPKLKFLVLLAILATSFSIDFAKSTYFSTPTAAESDSAIARNILPQDTSERWDRLYFTLNSYVGGFLSNPVFLLLGLFWIVKADASKGMDRLLLSLVFLSAIPIMFGSVEFQTRVLYNTPIHLVALFALYSSSHLNKSSIRTPLIIATVLVLVTHALRAMASLYLQLPEGFEIDGEFLLR